MAQHDQVIDNSTGLAVRTDMNAAFAAVFSSSSGPVEPTVKDPGQLWFDTSTANVQRLAVRDQANAIWVNLVLDGAGAFNSWSGVAANLAAGDTIEATGPNRFIGVTGGAVRRAGDTMTGPLKITKTWAVAGDEQIQVNPVAGNGYIMLNKPASGAAGFIQSTTAGKMRWSMALGNGVAESGGNVGSDFVLNRYTDAGAVIDTPLQIARSNGQMIAGGVLLCYGGSVQCRQVGTGNSIFQCLDTGNTAKAQFYWSNNGYTFVTNVAAGSNLNLGPSGDVSASPASGHNFTLTTGVGWQTGGGPWTALSDARIKTVQHDYAQGLAAVLALRPVVYRYNGNDSLAADEPSMHADATEKDFIGLVAQEAEIPMPEMVGQSEGFIDGQAVTDLRTLNNGPLVYALVNAIKELNAKITALEAKANG